MQDISNDSASGAAPAVAGRDVVQLVGVSKRFPGTTALDSVDFSLRGSEVHVLFGENGAGKSTLINIIAGTISPSSGRYLYRGEEVSHLTPARARAAGVCAVFQEFSLAPQMTVEENLFLGRELDTGGWLSCRAMRERARKLLRDLDFDIQVATPVNRLSRAQQQMVEIAKALLDDPAVLILDEPTASLTESETKTLFSVIARLKARGVAIIYVSHRMQEIRLLADRVTVLRDGRKITTVNASDVSDEELVTLMVGRQIDRLFPTIAHAPGAVRLEARAITLADGSVRDAGVVLRAGEIVGVGGLIGSGKSEFVRALFGLEPIASGAVEIDGAPVQRLSPARMLDLQVCYFPADRVAEGLALGRAIRENASITAFRLPSYSPGGFLRRKRESAAIGAIVRRLKLKAPTIEAPVGDLSGGNRQKVLLARGLARPTQVFLLEEPTVGIDVSAKLEVYQALKGLVDGGAAVLLVSSDLPELLHLAHRLHVFRRGRIVAELTGEAINEAEALSYFFDGRDPLEAVEGQAA